MTREQLEKLMDWVNARIIEESARNSSDSGLSETIRRGNIERELLNMFDTEDQT